MCTTWLLSLQMSLFLTHTKTYVHHIFRCLKRKREKKHLPYCIYFLFLLSFFSSYFSIFLHWLFIPAFLFFHTFLSIQDGKSSCPRLPSQCLMECCSLWPQAVWLCTPCTCLYLTSTSAAHVHSLSLSNTHRGKHGHTLCVGSSTHTHTRARCRSNSHKLNPNSTVQTNKLPTLELFLFLCTPTFLLSNSWTKHCPESSHPTGLNPSRCSVPFRTFMWASGDCYSDTLWALIKGQPE